MYEGGCGVSQDLAEAMRWYLRAADQGFSPAEVSLGRLYENGLGVARDEAEATKWYLRAARKEITQVAGSGTSAQLESRSAGAMEKSPVRCD
jgi:TPR repeat protein